VGIGGRLSLQHREQVLAIARVAAISTRSTAPVKVFDNFYFVGLRGAYWVIVTSGASQ
jgi:hypothetical protein